ncbi:MAG: hypothetical protein ABIJ05_03615 [Patescibacteria group bacterium]
MKFNFIAIGHWSFIAGIILAILGGFVEISVLLAVFFILGLIVGFLNIKEKEVTPFLVAVSTLLLIGIAGLQVGKLTPALGQFTAVIVSILNNFTVFMAAAGVVVALKQVIALAKPSKSAPQADSSNRPEPTKADLNTNTPA